MKNSAIMQMYYGERGHFESIKCSEKYFEILGNVVDYDEEIRSKLKKDPDLLSLYIKFNNAIEDMH
ncbi:MAG: hypothetical protein IJX05_04485, partial [Clostridia bacterium]|nr:hypothetical protein [Clostridia bacterium]